MKQIVKWTGFVLFAVVIGLALAIAFATAVRAQSPTAVVQSPIAQATQLPFGYNAPWGYGYGYGPGVALAPRAFGRMGRGWQGFGYGGWGMGPGMMRGYGYGHMGGMMGRWGYAYEVAPQGTPVAADEELQLEAANLRFDPTTITVKAGETVRLIVANRDSVPHNLFGLDLPIAYTLLPAGVSGSVTFAAPSVTGIYRAVCTFHPGMTLDIVVE